MSLSNWIRPSALQLAPIDHVIENMKIHCKIQPNHLRAHSHLFIDERESVQICSQHFPFAFILCSGKHHEIIAFPFPFSQCKLFTLEWEWKTEHFL